MARGLVGTGSGQTSILDVKLTWVMQASRMQTGFSIRRGAAAAATEQDLANHVNTNLATSFRAILPMSAQFTGVDVVDVTTKVGAAVSTTNTPGTALGSLAPGFVTAVLSLKGELRTRYGQGRMHLPCMIDEWANYETITTAASDVYQTFVTALSNLYVGAEVGQEWVMVNHHPALAANRPNNTRPGVLAVPASWYDVTSIRLNPQVGTLRSRKQGVGT